MTAQRPLPPGQHVFPSFDRFGLGVYAKRFPTRLDDAEIRVDGDVAQSLILGQQLEQLPRYEQVSDFHCVTTWSVLDQRWRGFSFRDFYHHLVEPLAEPQEGVKYVVLRGQDGYACCMELADLLADNVMLAEQLNGEPLGIAHGAPLRLVAPAHYGYKNIKHISGMSFVRDRSRYRFPLPYPNFMDHPRGRVAQEERAKLFPNWFIRPLYKLLMPSARNQHRKALEKYLALHGDK